MIKLKFLGAAQNVTGSRHFLQACGINVLVDCGLYQERAFLGRNWEKFPVAPQSINAVMLTHAHLDHCGYLPRLVKEGFRGKIYCTPATADLARLVLEDSAWIQEEDAESKRKRHTKQGRSGAYPEAPLYTVQDAQNCFELFTPVEYEQCVALGEKIQACFHNAGHVLGSSIIQIKARENRTETSILFTGDIGRSNVPIINDADVFDKADYILVESTYGNKTHAPVGDIRESIGDVVRCALEAGGNIVVPSFALERAQELLYYLNQLRLDQAIPYLQVFLDSPMASRITAVFKKYSQLFDQETTDLVNSGVSPFEEWPGLRIVGSRQESIEINDIHKEALIIASSGMCTGGRIKYHLAANISRPESTVMFVGYQAKGTLGSQILRGEPEVRIHGQMRPVHARIVRIDGFSAHADGNEILEWLKHLKTRPKAIFTVHGEAETAVEFADFLQRETGWTAYAPQYQEEAVL